MLANNEYEALLQKCQIGLNTQTPDEKFSDTCFPSKILVYLANGLHVVSSGNQAIAESEVGDLLAYYKRQSPQEIANAITGIDLALPFNPQARLKLLDNKACSELKELLELLT